VGHLGTLDPLATGVLPLLLGRATRLAQYFGKNRKSYQGVIRFGFATDTYDSAGVPTGPEVAYQPSTEALEAALGAFRGAVQQVPPPVSAKKVAGVPAYKLARANKPVALAAVDVEIYSLELLQVDGPTAELRIECSAGTYVRSIAHDLGIALGCGAHLQSLRRTASGEFTLTQARTLDQLGELAAEGRFTEAVVPGADLLDEMPQEQVDAATAAFIRQGREFRTSPFRGLNEAPLIKAISPDGDLIAIGQIRLPNLYHPVLVL
jgi:tRNA pseudouridine55 synthase